MIQRLSAFHADTRVIPEKPLYELPDFVIFSHGRHKTEKVSCETCHGSVWSQDVLKPELNMQMKACVDCHRKYQAAVKCTACHELSQ